MLCYLPQMCSPLPPSSKHKNPVGISARLPGLQRPCDIRAFCLSLAVCLGCFIPCPGPALRCLVWVEKPGTPKLEMTSRMRRQEASQTVLLEGQLTLLSPALVSLHMSTHVCCQPASLLVIRHLPARRWTDPKAATVIPRPLNSGPAGCPPL